MNFKILKVYNMKQNTLFKLSMFIIITWGIVFFLPILFGITISILSAIIYLATMLLPFAVLYILYELFMPIKYKEKIAKFLANLLP